MLKSNQKKIIVIVIIVIVIVIFSITLTINKIFTPSNGDTIETVDPLSGEKIVNIVDKDRETAGYSPDIPVLLGFNQILEYGVTPEEIEEIKRQLTVYAADNHLKYTDVISYKKGSHKKIKNENLDWVNIIEFGINGKDIHTISTYYNIIDEEIKTTLKKDGKVIREDTNLVDDY